MDVQPTGIGRRVVVVTSHETPLDVGKVEMSSQPSTDTPPAIAAMSDLSLEEKGRRLWEAIHTLELTPVFLARIELEMRQWGCSCAKFYTDWKKENPCPLEGSERDKFEWTVALHNAVNRKLNKPEMSVEDAWEFWREREGVCDQCGACCRVLGITFKEEDRQREPRLPIIMPPRGCPMVQEDGRCGCYETRPSLCRRFPPGGWLCNLARSIEGLEPLPQHQ